MIHEIARKQIHESLVLVWYRSCDFVVRLGLVYHLVATM